LEITFVRHAESVANLTDRWQGQSNSPLSERGREQAAALGRRLSKEKFDLVLVSDLDRTMETAAAIGHPIDEKVPEWREVSVGAWEGLRPREVEAKFPDQVKALAEGSLDTKIGGAESWNDLAARADAAFARIVARAGANDRVLVVSHGGIISNFLAGVLGVRGRHPRPIMRISNTAIARVLVSGGETRVSAFNDAGHLAPFGAAVDDRLKSGNTILALHAGGDPDRTDRFHKFHTRIAKRYQHGEVSRFDWATLAAQHKGSVVGIDMGAEDLAEHARTALALGEPERSRLAAATPGAYAHLIVSSSRTQLGDYNLSAHF
jgi:broad specificity phosphatase PhoE